MSNSTLDSSMDSWAYNDNLINKVMFTYSIRICDSSLLTVSTLYLLKLSALLYNVICVFNEDTIWLDEVLLVPKEKNVAFDQELLHLTSLPMEIAFLVGDLNYVI